MVWFAWLYVLVAVCIADCFNHIVVIDDEAEARQVCLRRKQTINAIGSSRAPSQVEDVDVVSSAWVICSCANGGSGAICPGVGA